MLEEFLQDAEKLTNIKALEEYVKKGKEKAQELDSKNLVLIIEYTGAGKSTFIKYIQGVELANYKKKIDREQIGYYIDAKDPYLRNQMPKIGTTGVSEAIYIQPYKINQPEFDDLEFADSPSFEDVRVIPIAISNSICITEGLIKCKSVKTIFLFQYEAFALKIGQQFTDAVKALSAIFHKIQNYIDKFLIIIRSKDEKLQNAKESVQKSNLSKQTESIINALKGEQNSSASKQQDIFLLQQLLKAIKDNNFLIKNYLQDQEHPDTVSTLREKNKKPRRHRKLKRLTSVQTWADRQKFEELNDQLNLVQNYLQKFIQLQNNKGILEIFNIVNQQNKITNIEQIQEFKKLLKETTETIYKGKAESVISQFELSLHMKTEKKILLLIEETYVDLFQLKDIDFDLSYIKFLKELSKKFRQKLNILNKNISDIKYFQEFLQFQNNLIIFDQFIKNNENFNNNNKKKS